MWWAFTSNCLLPFRYNAAFIENLTGQEQTTKGDIQHLTPAWPYQEDWQLLCQVEISRKLIRGRRGAVLIGRKPDHQKSLSHSIPRSEENKVCCDP